jgi:hypothetical protein
MQQIPPIEDVYIDNVIKSSGPLKPNLNKTQGIELRALVKLLRDRLENEIVEHYIANQTALAQKVDQVVGKQLSTEDFSTSEKQKLASLKDHTGDYIQASPLTSQNASIVVTGDISARRGMFIDGESKLSIIHDSNGYTGLVFNARSGGGTGLQLRYQPNTFGNGLYIYDPDAPSNTGAGNSDWKKILVHGDTLPLTGGTLTGDLYLDNLTDGQNDDYRIIVANNGQNRVKYVNKADAPWLLKNTADPEVGTNLFLGDFNNNMLFDGLGLQGLNNNMSAVSIRMTGGGGWNINSSNTNF